MKMFFFVANNKRGLVLVKFYFYLITTSYLLKISHTFMNVYYKILIQTTNGKVKKLFR